MNERIIKALGLFVASISAHAIAAPLPVCAVQAGAEFGVPEYVFEAMVLSQMDQPSKQTGMSRSFGQMALTQKMLKESSMGIVADPAVVAGNPCTNYRAAAWWLMSRSVHEEDTDIWVGVTRFYYGDSSQDRAPKTDRVRDIFEVISLPPTPDMLSMTRLQNPQHTLGRCIAKTGALAEIEAAQYSVSMAGALDVQFESEELGKVSCSATFRTVSASGEVGKTSTYSAVATE
ncbi:hypothetical protein [Pseudomonas syringae]|uniref:hypothetical protein n=1 Tax=Pseudomonas syringae TaxID=317 RepID=UPI00245F605E|nr:hypothetical protein [Pseudomonas syringae]MDH4602511.1 hypothetical protein [Pseudomonas syringae pv. papulans]